jgi:hypothetical protein
MRTSIAPYSSWPGEVPAIPGGVMPTHFAARTSTSNDIAANA